MKNIAILTGKLGGYEAMKALIQMLDESDWATPHLIITDQHLSTEHGLTKFLIERDFPTLPLQLAMPCQDGYSPRHRTISHSSELMSMATIMDGVKPDLLIVYGDRGESLMAAYAALNEGVPIAHIEGGCQTGGVDNSIRWAISALSTYHFVDTVDAQWALTGLRSIPHKNIHQVGNLHLDPYLNGDLGVDLVAEFMGCYNNIQIDEQKGYGILHLHPDTRSRQATELDVDMVERTFRTIDMPVLAIRPCNDTYANVVDDMLERLKRGNNNIYVLDYIAPKYYRPLLAWANFIVGNSSAGIIEAPFVGCPSIDIGFRQDGRLKEDWIKTCLWMPTINKDTNEWGEAHNTLPKALEEVSTMYSELPKMERTRYGDGQGCARVYDILKRELHDG